MGGLGCVGKKTALLQILVVCLLVRFANVLFCALAFIIFFLSLSSKLSAVSLSFYTCTQRIGLAAVLIFRDSSARYKCTVAYWSRRYVQKPNSKSTARTAADSERDDEKMFVSQHSSKPHVSSILYCSSNVIVKPSFINLTVGITFNANSSCMSLRSATISPFTFCPSLQSSSCVQPI